MLGDHETEADRCCPILLTILSIFGAMWVNQAFGHRRAKPDRITGPVNEAVPLGRSEGKWTSPVGLHPNITGSCPR